MEDSSKIKARVREILEAKGRPALKKAKKIILEEIDSRDLQPPLQHLAENWNDLLRPTLISLSCEAVGGKPEATTSAATSMILICSSLDVYDHIMDRTKFKVFVPTLPGKFGNGVALITAGLVYAKAFQVLYEHAEKEIPPTKHIEVSKLFQNFLLKMSKAEMENLKLRRQGNIDIKDEFKMLQMQAADIEACVKIGATIGCGSKSEIEHLGKYGLNLGTIILLRDDLWSALNLTVELANKIRTDSLPFILKWSANQSERARNLLSNLARKEKIEPADVEKVVDIMFETGAVEYVEKLFRNLNKRGLNSLNKIGESSAKDSLNLLLNVPTFPY